MFLVSRSIRWYVGHDHTGGYIPPLNRKYPNIKKKPVEIPTSIPYIYILVSCVNYHLMVHKSWWSPPHLPFKQELSKYLKNN
jgi:hypothetical protein